MTNYREILRLRSIGLSKLEIAECLPCSRNTVAVYSVINEPGFRQVLKQDSAEIGQEFRKG